VLAALLLSPGQPVSAVTLEECLWGENLPKGARPTLHAYISRLRGRLRNASGGQECVKLRAGGYQLEVGPEQIDLSRFNRLRRQAREAVDSGGDERAAELLREAESLWRGEALAGLPGEWATAARANLEESRLAARLERIEIELRLGGHAALIGELAELASKRPVNETVVGYLMIALHNAGRHAEALQTFRQVRKRLITDIGEEPGKDLQKIHQRILRDDPSLAPVRSAKPAASPGPPDTLLSDVPDFTGREAEVRSLIAACGGDGGEGMPETSIVIEAINGMPGVGKTALVTHVAHRLRDRYQDGRIYLPLRAHDATQAPLDPGSALAFLLWSFGVAVKDLPGPLDERASLWRSKIAGRRVLLILDDAVSAEQITPLLPGAAGSLVLITSRHRLTGFGGTAVTPLDVLSPADSSALFTRIAGMGRCQDAQQVAAVVRLCGQLPLAIRLAASHLRDRPSWSIGDLIDGFARARERGYARDEIARGLTRSFELSYQGLDNSQQQLFRCLGMHPGDDFSLCAAAAMNDTEESDIDQLLDSLVDRNLLEEPKRRRYRFHDLLQEYARRIAQRDEARLAVYRSLDYYLAVADQADRVINPRRRRIPVVITHEPLSKPALTTASAAKQWLDTERANLLSATQLAFDQDWRPHKTLFPHVLARAFGSWGHWEQAARYHRAAAATWRAAGDKFGLAQALAEVSDALWRTGRHSEALATADEALAIYQEIGDQQGEADTFALKGLASFGRSHYHQAQEWFQQALLIRQAIGDVRGEAEALMYGAIARYHVGNYRDVLTDLNLALHLNRSIEDRHGEYQILNNIGEVEKELGHYDAALQNYQASLEILQEVGTRQHQAVILNNLGELYCHTGKYQDALRNFSSAVELYREIKDLRGEADSLVNIAYNFQYSGHASDSIAYFEQALEIAQRIGNSYEQTRSLIGLGAAYYDLGDYVSALNSYQQGLNLAREMAAPREEAQARERIGATILMLHGASEARPWLEQALALYEQLGLPEAEELRKRLRRQSAG
jgi:tetratricopeptide (TPR) repeat protein